MGLEGFAWEAGKTPSWILGIQIFSFSHNRNMFHITKQIIVQASVFFSL